MTTKLPRFYPIFDSAEWLRRALPLGVQLVQIRIKDMPPPLLMGELALCQGYVLAAVRETVYRRSLPLATRNLQIATSKLGHDAGLMGAAQLVSDAVFAPAVVDSVLEQAR